MFVYFVKMFLCQRLRLFDSCTMPMNGRMVTFGAHLVEDGPRVGCSWVAVDIERDLGMIFDGRCLGDWVAKVTSDVIGRTPSLGVGDWV